MLPLPKEQKESRNRKPVSKEVPPAGAWLPLPRSGWQCSMGLEVSYLQNSVDICLSVDSLAPFPAVTPLPILFLILTICSTPMGHVAKIMAPRKLRCPASNMPKNPDVSLLWSTFQNIWESIALFSSLTSFPTFATLNHLVETVQRAAGSGGQTAEKFASLVVSLSFKWSYV